MGNNKPEEITSKELEQESYTSQQKGIVDIEIPAGTSNYFGTYEGLKQFSKNIAEINDRYKQAFAGVRNLVDAMKNCLALTQKFDFDKIIKTYSSALKQLANTISNISIPSFTEDEKRELIDSYSTWGKYGWTIIPVGDAQKLFRKLPQNKEEADKKASKYCTQEGVNSIIDALVNCKRGKKSDLDEAIFCYRNKKYKACALLLFGLIDSRFIRLQGSGNKNVGLKAVKHARQRAEKDLNDSALLLLLFYVNLFACLEEVFSKTDDFKKDTKVINRNYLDHGMLTRRVGKRDCIQLFVLYYNVLELLELLYG